MRASTNTGAKDGGFTLPEIIVVLSLIVIISAISVVAFFNLREKKSIDKDVDSVVSIIEKTRNMSLNRKNDSSYGVYFSTTSVSVYSGGTRITGNKISEYPLEAISKIATTSLSSYGSEIDFTKITGVPNATGTITISTASYSKVITVYGTGLVEAK